MQAAVRIFESAKDECAQAFDCRGPQRSPAWKSFICALAIDIPFDSPAEAPQATPGALRLMNRELCGSLRWGPPLVRARLVTRKRVFQPAATNSSNWLRWPQAARPFISPRLVLGRKTSPHSLSEILPSAFP